MGGGSTGEARIINVTNRTGFVHSFTGSSTYTTNTCIESIGKFPFFLFSCKLDRFAPNKLTELGCIN